MVIVKTTTVRTCENPQSSAIKNQDLLALRSNRYALRASCQGRGVNLSADVNFAVERALYDGRRAGLASTSEVVCVRLGVNLAWRKSSVAKSYQVHEPEFVM